VLPRDHHMPEAVTMESSMTGLRGGVSTPSTAAHSWAYVRSVRVMATAQVALKATGDEWSCDTANGQPTRQLPQ
jgi:hypothetical protein